MKNSIQLGIEIRDALTDLRDEKGWTVDDLAHYLEVNSNTLRNQLSTKRFPDMLVTILKLKNAIPESLSYEYKKAVAREEIEKRRLKNDSNAHKQREVC